MSAEDFSQKEILTKLMEQVDKIHTCQSKHVEFTKAKLESIEAQTVKTNGRVNKAEEEIDALHIRTENLGVKVAAGVFVASATFSFLLNKLL
jgi:hypothetical protein